MRSLKTQQSLVIFGFCLKKTRSWKSHGYRGYIAFEKFYFQKVFSSTRKQKAGVFKFLYFEERFRISFLFFFSVGIVLTVGLTVKNNALCLVFKFLL